MGPIVGRGVLLDIVAQRGGPLPDGTVIGAADLERAAKAAGVTVGTGDIVLIRTGWAEDQARRVTLDVPAGPVWVRSADEDLAAALDALLENVVAHTPEGTAFTVRLAPAEEGVHLDVLDDGPGIPATALQRGRSDRGSTGLGLDIARAAAEASGGSLELLHDPAAHGVRLFLRTETQPALTES